MNSPNHYRRSAGSCNRLVTAVLLALIFGAYAGPVMAQEPDRRQIRTYIPPNQLVSFSPSTPFNTFVEFVNPIFERVTGKAVVDPEGRTVPIGVNITRMHFLDALEQVLRSNNLWYRENDQYFVIQEAAAAATGGRAVAAAGGAAGASELASLKSREIRIDALLFEVNLNKAREVGIDWDVIFGGEGGGGGRGTGGGGEVPIAVRTDEFFDRLDPNDRLITPEIIEAGTITRLFRLMETDGIGRTIANPTVTVQSGNQGQIQIGADVPVVTRDFSGNSVVQMFQTGIIIDVTPTLISEAVVDTSGAPELDFVHLDVNVENSSSSPSAAGQPIISKTQANTSVLLLDGEQTIIGGLYTTDKTVSREGIPILKDLPWWVFGLRYIFGFTTTQTVQRELMIVLQAHVVDSLPDRADDPLEEDMLDKRRKQIKRVLQRLSQETRVREPLPSERYNK